ncbi:SDR family NAD(P)-dependent oxidoreductase [Aquirufa sp.]|jgi:NADP-dependent 3-hydroxy acid dehydrogenase YdfG|uniref:SDR family NAD(P)-dependent oxidoreductase n=1 Tax=Aquirufa sp. TaxID=2676249 RepID=UPI0037C148A9
MNRIACITGASSGIGLATAKVLSANGFRLILCGRRLERLEALKKDLLTESYLLTFDVRDRNGVENAFQSLPSTWQSIEVLINNAGNAHGMSAIQDGDVADWDAMMHSNVDGLLNVSRMVIPGMIQRASGHIVNLSSIAGKQVYPNGNVYCASKAAVEALSQGMRLDLNIHGIKVSNVAPGAVNTDFSAVRFKGDQQKADAVYNGFEPLLAEDVADLIQYIVTAPEHVNIADVTILPKAQASATQIVRKN